MSSRKSTDTTSQSGVSWSPGNPNAMTQKDINYSQNIGSSKLQTRGSYSGNAVEVWADGAVYDTVAGVFLFPGRDYDPNDIQRR